MLNKILTLRALLKKLPALRRSGRTIAFTNGCFDLMHIGHVKYLEKAGRGNRVLVVGLNSDRSIRRIKGPSRPIVVQRSRAAVLAALESVDFVVIFNEETPAKLIAAVKPDVLIKGADWKGKAVAGQDVVKRVEFVKLVKGFSTSHIIDKIKSEK
ncbi:MAG: adenylyltransferase/cytidyltransferase family protein [Candidatus Omnitrophica bacterium]|nr:adenylyltransferase/cytidyltransferase family protein [Candidatus Omnitrophota bacterium]MDE2222651.1 adenylyltransferase/cytidyltransferase family protein [Candidatus Omnitrophota bacterium]